MISLRPPNAPTGRPASDDLPHRCEIGFNSCHRLVSALRDAKPGHHFVKDKQCAVLVAEPTEACVKSRLWEKEPGVGRDSLNNHRRDLLAEFLKSFGKHLWVVEWNCDG